MNRLAVLLRPDWRKGLGTVLMVALLLAMYVQAYAFVDDLSATPAPALYEWLRPFDFWMPGMLLLMPLMALMRPLQWLSPVLIWPLQLVYCYLLACLLVTAHDGLGQWVRQRWMILGGLLLAAGVLLAPTVGLASRGRAMALPYAASSLLLCCGVITLYTYTALGLGIAWLHRRRAEPPGESASSSSDHH